MTRKSRALPFGSFFTIADLCIDRTDAANAPICLLISCSILPSNMQTRCFFTSEILVLKLLLLRQDLSSSLERTSHLFPIENHGIRLGGANAHHSRFTLGCKTPQYSLYVFA